MPDVQFLGHACVRIRGRDGIVICDPYSRTIGLDLGRPTAHIVTVSHDHPDHNNVSGVRPMRERLFVINGPGEYEVGGVLITGVRTYHDKVKGAERGPNTVYVIHLDEIAFCHLGDLGHELNQTQLEEIGSVDVLFVPVGGGETITPAEACSVIAQLEPRVVVPIHFGVGQTIPGCDLAPLERFIHEMGLKDVTPEERLSLTAASLTDESGETRVVVLRAVNE